MAEPNYSAPKWEGYKPKPIDNNTITLGGGDYAPVGSLPSNGNAPFGFNLPANQHAFKPIGSPSSSNYSNNYFDLFSNDKLKTAGDVLNEKYAKMYESNPESLANMNQDDVMKEFNKNLKDDSTTNWFGMNTGTDRFGNSGIFSEGFGRGLSNGLGLMNAGISLYTLPKQLEAMDLSIKNSKMNYNNAKLQNKAATQALADNKDWMQTSGVAFSGDKNYKYNSVV